MLHARELEAAYGAARLDCTTGVACAMRVLETERLLTLRGVHPTEGDIADAVSIVLERAANKKARDSDFLVAVKKEMQEMVDVAGDAYRRARDELSASARADKAKRRAENEALLAQELGKKTRREQRAFERKTGVSLAGVRRVS